ncbi:MFS transporter [Haloactinomyces albus]|uniref:EmrB/QacA subfamily drug resistance transporter n=1 Tax=Haloactinomyces albus TaxID=1352928 RepID=A0AAE3ZEA8_9ACTN|nr:MFS transporter [Haloactinomyces albus]MDR7301984.1 EmrB/QacA subfamily drug resistance transporter [Haloactinomyces albus]
MPEQTVPSPSARSPLVGTNSPERRENQWAVLAVVLAGFFMILLDGTIMNVAIPPIQEDMSASYSAAQWMMTGYALAYGLLLIPAGRLGDRFGHKRLFLIGLAGFTLASALCGQASTAPEIITWRIVQGITAGMMNPAVLAMIQAAFRPAERGRAFVWYGAVAGIAASLGPVLGGLFISVDLGGWSWRPIFLLNVPIGLIVLLVALKVLPDYRGRGGSLDPVGAALLTTVLLLVIYPLIQGYEQGWPSWVFAALTASFPMGALFVAWQRSRLRRGAAPLIDIRLFRTRSFAAGVATTLTQFIAFASLQFALSAYLQLGLGSSALATGLVLLPFAVGTFVGSSISASAVRRLGRRALHLGSGLLLVGTAGVLATIGYLGTDVNVLWLAPTTFASGIGAMMLGAPLLGMALTDVPGQEAGTAGGVIATAQRVGHALGIAIVGTALFGSLPQAARHSASSTLHVEYGHAIQIAGLFCLAACILTFLLIFLLPHARGDSSTTGDR